jgi:hypothetical protein
MADLLEHTAKSLKEFLEIIDGLANDPLDPVWFRGVGDSGYNLIPSLYRHPNLISKRELLDLEKDILVRFKERSLPYLTAPLSRNWEYLFLMQHYGVPTRLLDWTENPFVALFFALTSAKKDENTGLYVKPASIWILSPKLWNQRVFAHVSYKGVALSISDRLLEPYEPLSDKTSEPPAMPAAMFGLHNSPRIVAQRGVFTIFGSTIKSMDEIFKDDAFSDDSLIKVNFPITDIADLLSKLISTGHTDSMMFPSLEGLAKEAKRLYGFKE